MKCNHCQKLMSEEEIALVEQDEEFMQEIGNELPDDWRVCGDCFQIKTGMVEVN